MALGLGANLGTRREIEARFRHALLALSGDSRPPLEALRVASLYRTRALSKEGEPLDQPDFLNTVAVGEWSPSAEVGRVARRLLARCKALEAEAGRDLGAAAEAGDGGADSPRPLDLDLLLLGEEQLDLPPRRDLPPELWPGALRVPHPRLAERRFVLRPLAELVPHAPIPGDGRSVGEALGDLESITGSDTGSGRSGSGSGREAQRVERLPKRPLEI